MPSKSTVHTEFHDCPICGGKGTAGCWADTSRLTWALQRSHTSLIGVVNATNVTWLRQASISHGGPSPHFVGKSSLPHAHQTSASS
jgi:hypothetical protein